MSKFFATLHSGTKLDNAEIYLEKTLKDSVENLSLYDDDIAVVYEVTLTPIKRVMRGYVDLPLKEKKAKKKSLKKKSRS